MARAEEAARWEVISTTRMPEGVLTDLRLVTQTWHDIEWGHQLRLFIPEGGAAGDLVLLVLRQGDASDLDEAALATASRATGAASAFLFQMPNQPLLDGREEDALLAHTFSEFLRTGDQTWPLLLPMVKSVVRAMDAVQAVSSTPAGQQIRRYVVAGHSKRGHASWLAAAVDPRVAGIIPLANDVLNSPAQIQHHRAVIGDISASSSVFSETIEAADSDRGRCLIEIIDAYTYRDSLGEPKLIVLGTNDDYTPTDALNMYWGGLPGARAVLYLPNTNHAQVDSHPDVNSTAFAFVRAVVAGGTLPSIDAVVRTEGGTVGLRLATDGRAGAAHLWTAASHNRDFRSATWRSVDMRSTDTHSEWVSEIPAPSDGYVAVFGELEFEDAGSVYKLSTPIHVLDGNGHLVPPGDPVIPRP